MKSSCASHRGIDDHFLFAGKTKEKAITLVEFRPEPLAIVRTQRIALTELRRIGITRNDFAYMTVDRGKELCGRLFLVAQRAFACRISTWAVNFSNC
jgi:hypothetical protein